MKAWYKQESVLYWNGLSEQKQICLVTQPSLFSLFLSQGKPIKGGTHLWAWMTSVSAFLGQQRCPLSGHWHRPSPFRETRTRQILKRVPARMQWLKHFSTFISSWRHHIFQGYKFHRSTYQGVSQPKPVRKTKTLHKSHYLLLWPYIHLYICPALK